MKMKQLLIILLLVVSPVMAAYSGMFLEDFSDGNLDGWHIRISPGPPAFPVTDLLKFEDGNLVINTIHRGQWHWVTLELRTGNTETWDSYTLTYRIRFEFKENPKPPVDFHVEVRSSRGRLVRKAANELIALANYQVMWIFPDHRQEIHVWTFQPDEPPGGEPDVVGIHRVEFPLERLEQPIVNRWIPIRIVARGKAFEFYFDGHLVARYKDEKAGPGTVKFRTNSPLPVHLDNIVITGPRIPNIGGPHRVAPEARLATTWGEIKQSSRR